MLCLAKMGELAPLVRQTIACGYWKGGDRVIEDPLLAASDAEYPDLPRLTLVFNRKNVARLRRLADDINKG